MSEDWRAFWRHYRAEEANSEADLFVQVGKTVQKKPVPPEVFEAMVRQVVEGLRLAPGEFLIDLCCGNGLVTHVLSRCVGEILAIDFAEHLIAAARRFKAADNIRYEVGDVETALRALVPRPPDKVLMNDSLGYFTPESFGRVLDTLAGLVAGRPLMVMVTGVPGYEYRWNFYDTPERRARYETLEREGDERFDGMGRWWRQTELEAVGRERGFRVRVERQPEALSRYRVNAFYALGPA
jgi:SAM-dependent methyltransferase